MQKPKQNKAEPKQYIKANKRKKRWHPDRAGEGRPGDIAECGPQAQRIQGGDSGGGRGRRAGGSTELVLGERTGQRDQAKGRGIRDAAQRAGRPW